MLELCLNYGRQLQFLSHRIHRIWEVSNVRLDINIVRLQFLLFMYLFIYLFIHYATEAAQTYKIKHKVKTQSMTAMVVKLPGGLSRPVDMI